MSTKNERRKHTPGPWGRRKQWNTDRLALEIFPTQQKTARPFVPSAVCNLSEDRDEALANAHLISAAPELYETCKAIFPILEAVRYSISLGKTQLARIEAAKAAIAKAEGRTP